ncbi:hypothetical protein IWW48_002959 [Coemansia sp. RSA 1200]|nr:hypothetical protein IWW48_002959 [Coemansia sp. RSA 1200]
MTVKSYKLNNGTFMPEVGLGTWRGNDDGALVQTVKTAIELGYRHIDCAPYYANQRDIGKALKEIQVPREDLFIVSKLQLDYLDMLLMHWPFAVKPEVGFTEDYGAEDIENVPNGHMEGDGSLEQELVEFCKDNNIVVTAYCPLGGYEVNVMDDELLKRIADAHSCTPAQVALSWERARGIVVIPKSTNPICLKQNLEEFVALTPDEMRMIGNIKRFERNCDPGHDFKELNWVFYPEEAECPVV